MNPSIFYAIFLGLLVKEIAGHGMMLEPINRASLWRFNITEGVPDYDDNQNYCGGLTTQTNNGGLCGVCGDSYTNPHPQDNENTGKYGVGYIVETYTSGSVIDVEVKLTANHLGAFSYSLCILADPNAPESGEDCFTPLVLEDGSSYYNVTRDVFYFYNRVQLPETTCDRCVLRWHYKSGNNWGECDDGTYALGCGPQETFRSCADITIV